jgi:hypothetical protein
MNRLFWTEMGRAVLGEETVFDTGGLTPFMVKALESPPPLPADHSVLRGEDATGRRGRYIYNTTWDILRTAGFSRPLRLSVLGGVELLVPFVRLPVAIIPQGFQTRVPPELRALSLVGKSAALRVHGLHLAVCAAMYVPEAWDILQKGNCSVCTPDFLRQLVRTLDFSQ